MPNFDALIIGGGPAGATTALLLAKAGWTVALVEKKKFPRPKVCGEFISATSLPLWQELGLLDYYRDHGGPEVRRVGWFAGERILMAAMPAADNALGKWGRALGRETLDSLLLDEAKQRGVHVWQPWRACELVENTSDYRCTIATQGKTAELSAKVVIMAHGSWEQPVIKQPQPVHKKSDLLAFKAHFQDSALDSDLMSLLTFPGGYGGLVHSDQERVTLSCCIRRDRLQTVRLENPGLSAGDAVLKYISRSCLGVRNVFATARREDPWLAVGPIRPGIRTCYKKGIFYVGNIAGESHPIIAEGISMAMQSAWLLSQSLSSQQSMQRTAFEEVGRLYQTRWHSQFAPRIRSATLFAQTTTRPMGMNLLVPIVQRFPGILTLGATLSGKVKEII